MYNSLLDATARVTPASTPEDTRPAACGAPRILASSRHGEPRSLLPTRTEGPGDSRPERGSISSPCAPTAPRAGSPKIHIRTALDASRCFRDPDDAVERHSDRPGPTSPSRGSIRAPLVVQSHGLRPTRKLASGPHHRGDCERSSGMSTSPHPRQGVLPRRQCSHVPLTPSLAMLCVRTRTLTRAGAGVGVLLGPLLAHSERHCPTQPGCRCPPPSPILSTAPPRERGPILHHHPHPRRVLRHLRILAGAHRGLPAPAPKSSGDPKTPFDHIHASSARALPPSAASSARAKCKGGRDAR